VRLKLILGNQNCFDVDKAPAVMPIQPEIVIATGLRCLAGSPSLDLHLIMLGMSITSVYCCPDTFLKKRSSASLVTSHKVLCCASESATKDRNAPNHKEENLTLNSPII
jgi:hypothetical protein